MKKSQLEAERDLLARRRRDGVGSNDGCDFAPRTAENER